MACWTRFSIYSHMYLLDAKKSSTCSIGEGVTQVLQQVEAKRGAEVRQMARKVASGQLELVAPCLLSDFTSESEVESVKEAFQHVTSRVQKSQDQQGNRWNTGDTVEPWDVGCEGGSESEESDLESVFRSPGGKAEKRGSPVCFTEWRQHLKRWCLSQGHSRELPCCFNSSPNVSEEFVSADPDYFLPPAAQGGSEPEVKDADTTGIKAVSRALDLAAAQFPKHGNDSCFYCLFFTGGNELLVKVKISDDDLLFPYSSVEAAQEMVSRELQEDCKEKDISVTDIEDLSSIPCEENYYEDINCKTPAVSHAAPSVSTPISSALAQASIHLPDELPPPAQELLDEIGSDQIKMEGAEAKEETEMSEKCDSSVWTLETFNLAEETERYEKDKDDNSIYHCGTVILNLCHSVYYNKIQCL
ncbi:UNVERIFIED_CONTAM: hypothetical protein H355_004246 [Colinus virginianus]|nr:hypothetical protein H355_004246 [Colinus virginianus]